MLRDRLVCGINQASLQHRLLDKATLTLQKVLQIAQAFESAEKNSRQLQTSTGALLSIVHAVSRLVGSRTNFRDVECFSCGVKGHLARMCCRRERSRAGRVTQAYRLAESEQQEAEDGVLVEYSLF